MSRIHDALEKAERESSTATIDGLHALEQPATVSGIQEKPELLLRFETHLSRDLHSDAGLTREDIESKCLKVEWRPDPLTNVFGKPTMQLRAVEQFRTLRSRLYHLRTESQLRVLLITSPISGDGKTFVASNLAQAIVRQPDRRVLLIDADLRSSALHVPLGAASSPGLAEYLAGATDETSVIQYGGESGLYFIAGGKPASNASDLLSNGRFNRLIERTVSCFDWVIIDSPPCLPVADASVIAGFCDGIVMVLRSGSTPSSAADKACQELRKRNMVGVILNAVDEKALGYGSYAYPDR